MSANEALNRVTAHASDDEWRVLYSAIRRAAIDLESFTTDAAWGYVRGFHGERRLMGSVVRQAMSDGLIEKQTCRECGSDVFEDSEREEANSNPKRVYRSLAFGSLAVVEDEPEPEEDWVAEHRRTYS